MGKVFRLGLDCSLLFSVPALHIGGGGCRGIAGDFAFPPVVGYSAKEHGSKSPAGIITFQWDDVGGKTVYLNGFIKPSVAGTAYEHCVNGDFTPGWE